MGLRVFVVVVLMALGAVAEARACMMGWISLGMPVSMTIPEAEMVAEVVFEGVKADKYGQKVATRARVMKAIRGVEVGEVIAISYSVYGCGPEVKEGSQAQIAGVRGRGEADGEVFYLYDFHYGMGGEPEVNAPSLPEADMRGTVPLGEVEEAE